MSQFWRLSGMGMLVVILAACGRSVPVEQADGPTDVSDAVAEQVNESEPVASIPESDGTEAEPETAVTTDDTATNETVTEETTADTEEEAPVTPSERSYAGTVPAPEFPPFMEWLNVGRPLTMAELRGKVVLLDFWTYGCINCIHVIPELKQLEEKYADELVIIGVHSAKFANEGETDNIRQVILRYELEHPVVNDNEFVVWRTYGANAWPTFVLIDPEGNVLGFHSGEDIYEPFDFVIGNMIAEFDAKGLIDRTPLELILEKEGLANSPLLFPGKVLADAPNNRLFIADSNHNRIVVTDLQGQVLDVIGNGIAALQDGTFETASFFRPQGLTLADEDTLYVADTENHAIRRVDLQAKIVETVAGNGRHGSYEAFEGRGTGIALNSPWDVLYQDGIVYIAMAGQHQLWQYDPDSEIARVFAGSGREELSDGSLEAGGLNQPSGLATDGQVLFFADSEASAIRTAGLNGEGLQTIVGTGLFDFGDVDGIGEEVRLQHPLGVVYQDGVLYVADTYNNKIKRIDPQTRGSTTFLGGGEDGWRDGVEALFDEPGGLSIAGDTMYIADTNNHVIRIANLSAKEVSTLVLVDNDGLLTRQPEGIAYAGKVIPLEMQTVAPGAGTIRLQIELPSGYKLNDIAPFTAEWTGSDGIAISEEQTSIQIVEPSFPLDIPVTFTAGETNLQADLVIYYCEAEAESLCLIEQVRLLVPVSIEDGGSDVLTVTYIIPAPGITSD